MLHWEARPAAIAGVRELRLCMEIESLFLVNWSNAYPVAIDHIMEKLDIKISIRWSFIA